MHCHTILFILLKKVFIVKCVDGDKVQATHAIVKERFSKTCSLYRKFLKLVYEYAGRDVLVDEKDYTEISSPFVSDFTGFTYSRQHLPPSAIIREPLVPYLMVIPVCTLLNFLIRRQLIHWIHRLLAKS